MDGIEAARSYGMDARGGGGAASSGLPPTVGQAGKRGQAFSMPTPQPSWRSSPGAVGQPGSALQAVGQESPQATSSMDAEGGFGGYDDLGGHSS